jgi:hypothetical protein
MPLRHDPLPRIDDVMGGRAFPYPDRTVRRVPSSTEVAVKQIPAWVRLLVGVVCLVLFLSFHVSGQSGGGSFHQETSLGLPFSPWLVLQSADQHSAAGPGYSSSFQSGWRIDILSWSMLIGVIGLGALLSLPRKRRSTA